MDRRAVERGTPVSGRRPSRDERDVDSVIRQVSNEVVHMTLEATDAVQRKDRSGDDRYAHGRSVSGADPASLRII